jgi:NAD-dependent DNA ligase
MRYVNVFALPIYKKGDRVVVEWHGEGYFTGVITRVSKGKVSVLFDDGDSEDIPSRSKRIVGPAIDRKRKTVIDEKDLSKWLLPEQSKTGRKKPPKVNIDALKRNPVQYAESLPVPSLVKVLKDAKDAYYNGSPLFSDKVFDTLEEALRRRDPRNPVLKEVGAPIKRVGKVKLPFYMGSLDKVKPDILGRWIENNPGPYVLSDKVDGVSLLLVGSSSGWGIFSRGNGTYGQDLSHLAPYIKLPQSRSKIVVRAEAIMSKGSFKAFEESAENPRNFVSGLLNRKDVNVSGMESLDVIAYELIQPVVKPSAQFKKLKQLGFKVVPSKVYNTVDAGVLTKLFEARRSKSQYDTDGIVITIDKVYRRATSGNPPYSVAFKTLMADQTAAAKVLEVTWQESRHRMLKPVVIIEPTRLSGVTIKRVTAHNARFIVDNRIGPGAVIQLVRSGDVIPYIKDVLKPARKPQLPDREYEWNETEVDIYIPEGEESNIVAVKKITHFFRTLGVENFSEGLVTKFYNDGLDTINKIINASERRMAGMEGMGEVMAEKIRSNIDSAINGVDLFIIMFASGVFRKDMGSTRLNIICNHFPNIMDVDWDFNTTVSKISNLSGFSTKTAESFADGIIEFRKFYKKLPSSVVVNMPVKRKRATGPLTGVSVCFTGFRDKLLERTIMEKGGEVKSGISRQLTVLLVKDMGSSSSKMNKAREYGVRVMTVDMFRRVYKI